MPSKDQGEDIAFFLYLLPIVAAIIYGVYEWASIAHTSAMPFLAYAIVAKSPYLFLASLISVCLAIMIEVRSASLPQREGIVKDNTVRLMWLAIIVLIISIAAAISVADYNLPNGISIFINGRYPLIYAFFLVGISLLLSPKGVLSNAKISSLPEVIGLVILVASPVLFYLGTKVKAPFAASSLLALIVGAIGIVLLVTGSRIFGKKRPKPVVAAAKTT